MGKDLYFNTIDQVLTDAVNKGVLHLNTGDTTLTGNTIKLNGKDVLNFGSCSYLGLEFDQRMIASSIEAVKSYGTQFSASRGYVSTKHYKELEGMFDIIFGASTVVAPTTTLGHLSVIPVLVNSDDAIVLDHQVHNSVRIATNLVKPDGVHVELIRHNRMDLLEDRVKVLRQKHKRIWYMADGIYSMYGDCTPVNEVYELLDKYPELYYYIDDAHGMSCFGKHGRGYVLSQKPIHEKMIFTTSLAKAFATGGSVLVFPNKELARKVKTCGAGLVTSGPMQPATLGAAIGSAKIHLSDEIYTMQEALQENIKYCNLLIKHHGLPIVAETETPVFFIGVGLPKLGYNLIHRMLKEGYYLNLGMFPAVPMKNTGVRFTITRLHTFRQIERMVETLAHHYPKALKEEGFSMEKVYQAFNMKPLETVKAEQAVTSLINQSNLKIQHEKSIELIDEKEWNGLLGNRGSFDWNGLQFLESSFTLNKLPENNWEFDYLIVRDTLAKPILATFMTTTLNKDDMLSPNAISKQIEEKRFLSGDPYYMTSQTLFVGSLLTEGNHLYLDRSSPFWKDAMQILFEKIAELQENYNATIVNLRDFDAHDDEMDSFLVDNGFFKINMPDNHVINRMDWKDRDEYISGLSKKSRRHVREFALRYEDKYDVKVMTSPSIQQIQYWYELYMNVKQSSLTLNTFNLPFKVFANMATNKNWDLIELRLKPGLSKAILNKPVAIMCSYIGQNVY
ncbi:MAG: aminotransferase class I/II, partial [Bacteroidetes bacterium]